MKKIFLMAGIITLIITGAACNTSSSSTTPPATSTSTSQTDTHEEYSKTPDVLEWKADVKTKDKIITELKSGKQVEEISKHRNITIPSDVYPPQFGKFFQLDDMQFAIVQVMHGASFVGWDDKSTTSSGVWYADKNDTVWKPLVTLTQAGGYNPHNNIFDFWNEGNQVYMLMIDGGGAGNGDGTTKIISSSEVDKNWNIRRCIYLSGGVYDFQREKGIVSFHKVVPQWLQLRAKQKDSDTEEYAFNSSFGKFEATYFDPDQNKNITHEVDDCQNISLPYLK